MKKLFLWIIFLAIAFFLSMQISKEFQAKVLYLSDAVKIGILNLNTNVVNIVTRYFNQAEHIKDLSNALHKKENLQYLYDALQNEHNALLEAVDMKPTTMQVVLSRMISYVEINNYTKIWLDSKNLENKREKAIFGMISDNKAAGIAVYQEGRLQGFLNGNEKCSYSVNIGDNTMPGVAKYDINKGFVVDYIPLYPRVEIGDNVYTSGFDEIFYPGIFVGIVESVEESQGYQIARVKPATIGAEQFYWLVDIDSLKSEFLPQQNTESQDNTTKIFDFNKE